VAQSLTQSIEKPRTKRSWAWRHRKLLWIVAASLGIALAIGGYFAEKYWPYRYRNVKPLLEQVFASKVTISHYHRTYFPHPGFVADQLTLRRTAAPGLPPIGSTQELIVQGTWLDLLTLQKRVMLVDVKGLHVIIPALGSPELQKDFPAGSSADFTGPTTTVETLRIHPGVLDIMKRDGGRYTYPIKNAVFRNLKQGQTMDFYLDMQNASPEGPLQASGTFGPILPKNVGATPLSGRFTFAPVNLNQIGKLHGILQSKGQFKGRLTAIEVFAEASTPDFAVSDGRTAPMSGWVQCTVNGMNLNIVLHQIEVKTGASTVEAGGEWIGFTKATHVQFTVTHGRAEDLLRPFLHDPVPIVGPVSLKADAHLAPDGKGETFLHRLTLDGSFNVPEEQLTNRNEEKTLTNFSERAQGAKTKDESKQDDAEGQGGDGPGVDVLLSLVGRAQIRDGVVSTRRLEFGMPGASADLSGWYQLSNGTVHLDGELKMEQDISHTQTGFKSVLLKPLAPFFKKKHAGAVVPIAVTGERGHYKVSQNLMHNK
jgi:hypothetical protein